MRCAGRCSSWGSITSVRETTDRASDYFAQSRAASLAVGDRWITSVTYDGLAHVARAQGDTETARRLFAEELALHRELGDKHGIGHTLRFLGELAEEAGDGEAAETCYAEALIMLRDAWAPDRLTAVLRGVAALALAREQPARALRLAGAVVRNQSGAGRGQACAQKWSPDGLGAHGGRSAEATQPRGGGGGLGGGACHATGAGRRLRPRSIGMHLNLPLSRHVAADHGLCYCRGVWSLLARSPGCRYERRRHPRVASGHVCEPWS